MRREVLEGDPRGLNLLRLLRDIEGPCTVRGSMDVRNVASVLKCCNPRQGGLVEVHVHCVKGIQLVHQACDLVHLAGVVEVSQEDVRPVLLLEQLLSFQELVLIAALLNVEQEFVHVEVNVQLGGSVDSSCEEGASASNRN